MNIFCFLSILIINLRIHKHICHDTQRGDLVLHRRVIYRISTRYSASFEAEPPASSRGGSVIPLTIRTGLRPVSGSRHGGGTDNVASVIRYGFLGDAVPITSDTVAHVAGITGRSSPAPDWWGRRPRRSFGTGEERPSSPAITDGESHIKATERRRLSRPWQSDALLLAPPSTSEVARPSEVGSGRLHRDPLLNQDSKIE